jgi:hypothetical protein
MLLTERGLTADFLFSYLAAAIAVNFAASAYSSTAFPLPGATHRLLLTG